MKLLSYQDLGEEKGIWYSKVQLWRLERAGQFPIRTKLGVSRHGWIEAEIDEWLETRANARKMKAE